MVKISYTNIIVDQFSTARNNPFNKYIHFLTHIHADHIKGLSNSWEYGPIYCSPITKKLILLKYPRLQCLKQLQLDTQHTIHLSSELEVTVTLFDANHCAGSVILLIEGYMGTVLYSGDMRFDREVFQDYTYLYPHSKRNKDFKGCSIGVDFLYLDTTFLHPKFSFPPKEAALGQLDSFIDATIKKAKEDKQFIEFYIGIDSFGKEEVLVHLAEKFQTLVVVSEDRYKNISTVGLDSELFTTDPQAGFIHVVQKRQLKGKIAGKPNSMGIILTGWANKSHYRSQKTYAIPYSLHSSYPELVAFVDSIRPAFIQSIIQVSGFTRQEQSSRNRGSDGSRNKSNEYFGQDDKNEASLYDVSGTGEFLNKLRQDFCSRPSEEIQHLIGNTEFQMKIKEKLKLDRKSVQINREEFGMTTNIVRVQNINRAGAKITKERNQQQIQKLKLKLKQKQQMLTNKTLQYQRSSCENRERNIGKVDRDSGDNILEIQDTPERDLEKSDQSILDKSDQNFLEKSDEKSDQSMLNRSNQSVLNRSKDSAMNRSGDEMGNSSVQSILSRSIEQKNFSNSSSLSSRRQSGNLNSRPNSIKIHIKSSQCPQTIPQEQDPQAARRNKWLKKVEQGEIDLFGKMPSSVIKINDTRKSEDTKAMNEMLRERIFNKGSKKKKLNNECIDLVDDQDNNNDQKGVELERDQITLDMYRGARRERSQVRDSVSLGNHTVRDNSQNKINAINEIGDDTNQCSLKKNKPAAVKARFSDTVQTNFNQLFTLPSQKPADQRAITQFFTSPSKKPKLLQKPQPSLTLCQNHNLQIQSNPTRPNRPQIQHHQEKVEQSHNSKRKNRQADQDDDSEEQSLETLRKRSQAHFSHIDVIRSWRQCSMMAIDLNNLATDAKQADVRDYGQFFISK